MVEGTACCAKFRVGPKSVHCVGKREPPPSLAEDIVVAGNRTGPVDRCQVHVSFETGPAIAQLP